MGFKVGDLLELVVEVARTTDGHAGEEPLGEGERAEDGGHGEKSLVKSIIMYR